jgi:thiol-disulfide isomerase/thioredoxin
VSFFALEKSSKHILWGLALSMIFAGLSHAAEVFPSFSSQSSKGEAVTDAIFADSKLTVVNIWTTWCPPCREEMPDLGHLGRTMPEGSRLVGLILDADDSGALEEAEGILTRAKADFLQILPVQEMASVLKEVTAIPTTIFVDSQGRIVGVPLDGSRSEEAYRTEIEKILASMP